MRRHLSRPSGDPRRWGQSDRHRAGTVPRGGSRRSGAGPAWTATCSSYFVPSKRIVLALAVALFAVMSAPAWATVHRSTRRRTPARHIASSCPGGTAPHHDNISLIRAAILCLVNRERADRGERPLAPDMRLQRAAQAHSDSMAFKNYFEHIGPHGDTPLSRIRATGLSAARGSVTKSVRTLAGARSGKARPSAIVAAWMASPGHRANILDPRFRDRLWRLPPSPLLARPGAGRGDLHRGLRWVLGTSGTSAILSVAAGFAAFPSDGEGKAGLGAWKAGARRCVQGRCQ